MKQLLIGVLILIPQLAAGEAQQMPIKMPEEMRAALELKADIERGRHAYALCASCHYDHGHGHPSGSFPAIAGQHKSVVIKQMADFRARNRDNPTMYPFADPKSIGDAQAIADVAAYISSLPANHAPATGMGDNLQVGEELYNSECASCHEADGSGSEVDIYPRLKGQQYAYLDRQSRWIRDGIRRNANSEMKKRLEAMSDEEISAVSDYISRIR